MTVIATTVFYNRLDLLEIWMNELKDVVDKFVVLEGNISHTGIPRELVYKPELFKDFNVKYVPITDMPPFDKVHWDRMERYLNASIVKALEGCEDTDLILFNHSDEVIKTKAFELAKKEMLKYVEKHVDTEAVIHFHLIQCRYWLNCFLSKQEGFTGAGPVLSTFRVMREVGPWRMKHIYPGLPCVNIINAGWHYSWTGPKEYILDKLYNTVEQSYNKPEMFNFEYIQKVMDEGGDILQEARNFNDGKWIGTLFLNPNNERVSSQFLPLHVKNNLDKFKDVIKIKDSYNIG